MEFNTEKFINHIKEHPAIWDTRTTEYLDADCRSQQWKELVNIYGGEDMEYSDRMELSQTLQKKWKNIRDNYVRELRRRERNPHHEKCYAYFKRLTFLKKVISRNRRPFNQNETDYDEEKQSSHTPQPRRARKRSSTVVSGIDNPVEVEVDVDQGDTFDIMLDETESELEPKTSNNQYDGVECFFDHELQSNDRKERDECHVFGELVAVKLRKLNPRTRSFVQHLINNTLFEAEMGRYDQSSKTRDTANSFPVTNKTIQSHTSGNSNY